MSTMTCARHGTETRLTCGECGAAICPRCMVETPVGHKCPSCARQAPAARRQGSREQYGRAVGAGVLVAGGGGLAFGLFASVSGFLLLIAGYFLGVGAATAVQNASANNRAEPFRNIAAVAAVAAVAIGFVFAYGTPIVRGTVMLAYLAAGYGVWTRY